MSLDTHQHGKSIQHCQKCGKSGAGENHTIYYGNSRRVSGDVFTRTYQIQIGGSRSAWICERCKRKAVIFHWQPWLLMASPLAVYTYLSLNYVNPPLGEFLGYTLMLYIPIYFASAQSKHSLLEFWYGAGSRQVKKVFKKELNRHGWPIVWTLGEYEQMMKRNR